MVLVVLLLIVLFYDVYDLVKIHSFKVQQEREGKLSKREGRKGSFYDFEKLMVDIVIPVYNMGDTFARTLGSVERSGFKNKRVFVVDDGSDDGKTPQILDGFKDRVDLLVHLPHGGKAKTVNFGAEKGKGGVIFFLDADSHVRPDFIEVSLSELNEEVDAIDFVQQVANPGDSVWTRIAAFEREILTFKPDNFGALFVIKREVFNDFKFRDCLSPQLDIDQRLLTAGKLKISPEKVVFADEPVTFKHMYLRKRRWVYGMLQTYKMNNQRLDFHIYLPFLDLFLLFSFFLVFFDLRFVLIPVILLFSWFLKTSVLSKMFKQGYRMVPWYVLYMIILSIAVIDAVIRFKIGRKVSWV
ncbi:MAG: glycosyltransferase [Candidatus Hodarchaeota archaeon]